MFKKSIFYGWWIAGIALAINTLVSGPVYGGAGLWIDALELDFGWSRTQLAIAFSLGQLEGSFASPIVGYLIDKFGGRKVIVIGAFFTAAGFFILSETRPVSADITNWFDPIVFYLAYVVVMMGVSLGSWIPTNVVINSWFDRRRSLALSIGAVGFSLGTFAIVPILAHLISPEVLGWKNTSLCLGVVFVLLSIPEYKFIKNNPEEIGEVPDGRKAHLKDEISKEPGGSRDFKSRDFSLMEAMREKTFWVLAIGHGSSAMLTSTMMVHLILAFKNQGLSLQTSALMWGITMGIGGLSILLGGVIGDKVSKSLSMSLFGCLQCLGVVLAVFVHSVPMAILFAIVYGTGFGARGVIMMAIRGEYFGRKSLGKIIGISATPMMIMQMITPIVAARFYDHSGNYFMGFLLIAFAGLLGSLLLLFAKRPIHPLDKKRASLPKAVGK